MQKQFSEFIERKGLLRKGQPVFAAVSGGIDSMVMLHLFSTAGFDVSAVHVNFGLRGEESDEDESFVKARCAQFNIPFLSKPVATKNYATEEGVSIQMAARELRYQWFHELDSVVATAHHLNDSAETMLMNLVRGTGTDGLAGIPVKNRNVIRPLLFATRDDINRYAAENGITWREDESNSDDQYKRNFIRHRVMPLLRQLNPNLEETLRRNAVRVAGDKSDNKAGLLIKLIEPFGFNFSTAESVGKKFYSDTHQLVIDRDQLIISPLEEKAYSILIEVTSDKSFTQDPSIAYLDLDKIKFPLILRTWREGDSFQPLGMSGTKKVSDFLIDEKISLYEKGKTMVLISDEKIVWILGRRIADPFKITEKTKQVLRISLKTETP